MCCRCSGFTLGYRSCLGVCVESSSICIETMSLLLCTLYAIKDTYVLTFITVATFCGECALSAWFLLLLIIIMTHDVI